MAITCVIYGHLHPFVDEPDMLVRKYIYSFHMPIFFMISGFLFGEKVVGDKFKYIKGMAKKLLIPYLFYNVYIVLGLIFKHDNVQEVLIRLITINMPTNAPCWFFFAFFIIKVVADICSYKSRIIIAFSLAIVYCAAILLYGIRLDSFFCINAILCGFIFYVFGQICRKIFTYSRAIKISVTIICLLLTILIVPRYERFDMYVGNCSFPVAYLMASAASSLAVLLMCNLLYGNRKLVKGDGFTKLSRGTMFILGTHYPIVAILKKGILVNHHSIVDKFVLCLLFIVAYYFIINFTYDRFPFLYGKSKKKA